jgi:hypothetical protein
MSEEARFVRLMTARGWARYLILAPTLLAAALITMFFFAAFLALFTLGAVSLGLWSWWLRRRLRKARSPKALKGEYVVTKETKRLEKNLDHLDGQ